MDAVLLVVYVALVMLFAFVGINQKGPFYSIQVCNARLDLHKFFSLILLAYLFVLASINTSCPDYSSYRIIYYIGLPYDDGFNTFIEFCKNLGIEYHQFRIIVFAISYTCILIYLWQIKVNTDLALALYAIYPFFFDAIQIRNLLAFSIIIVFLPMLFKNGKKGLVCFVGAVLLASTVHKLSLIYIILVYVKLKDSKTKMRLLAAIFVASFIFMIVCKFYPSNFTLLFNVFSDIADEHRSSYASKNFGMIKLGFLFSSFMELLFLASAYFSHKAYGFVPNIVCKEKINYPKIIFQINTIMSCTFPVFLIGGEFYRVFRNLALINYLIPINNIWLKQNIPSNVIKSDLQKSTCFFIAGFVINWLQHTFVNGFDRVVWVFFESP